MKQEKGFTIIELIVVVAIIAVLASIVLINVTQYSRKVKVTRALADAQNIGKALVAFYAQYGDYPYHVDTTVADYEPCPAPGCSIAFVGTRTGGTDPYLGDDQHLSGFYNSEYNADYFIDGGFYDIYLYDNGSDSKIGCGYVNIENNSGYYGTKYILCQDCPENCDGSGDTIGEFGTPFKLTSFD